ncbi:MAG: transcription factor [Sphingobium sp.]|uniref:Transcription factor n=2 Tax=Sphingomonadaceae TaxID=41297 RepID=A0A9X7UEL8_SPHYA|nr:MAG: transcription factor [Sphingobium sp.]QNG48888.1 transcription factor [Sphingobium yanoikuyae]
MGSENVFEAIKQAIEGAPRNGYVAELHLQCIKYAAALEGISGREFCERLELGNAWGTEFAKMRKIAPRLKAAGLNIEKI